MIPPFLFVRNLKSGGMARTDPGDLSLEFAKFPANQILTRKERIARHLEDREWRRSEAFPVHLRIEIDLGCADPPKVAEINVERK